MATRAESASRALRGDGMSPEPSSSELSPLLSCLLTSSPERSERVVHVRHVPRRAARSARWPDWVPGSVSEAFRAQGIERPWTHQVETANHAHEGRSVVLTTGTASGKSLGYLLPALHAVLGEADRPRGASVLYLAPTKALAWDQLRALRQLGLPEVRPAALDGDTPVEERDWVRAYGRYVLTNPDMLHRTLLPGHARWSRLFSSLRFVVVDECHAYRGVFGSHVAQVIRRLRRVCAQYGSEPVFVLTSATVSEAAASAERLLGLPVAEVSDDGSPRGATTWLMWEPPLTDLRGEQGAPVRRPAAAETAGLLADLVGAGRRTLAFVRSRRGAEQVAISARRMLAEVGADLADQVAAYRAGYLPEERRALERSLQSGDLLGLATTTALELGLDVSGLDAVLLAGYPGTRCSLWQQAGRAGRARQDALAVLVARDDPLDTYLVHHPAALFDQAVEATVFDPDNPYVVAPHVAAAAAELPLSDEDVDGFGPAGPAVVRQLADRGLLRRRARGWYWTRRERPTDQVDIRGAGGSPVRVVEKGTGRVLGTVDEPSSHLTVHTGAVYVHQGESYLVESLDLAESVALVERAEPDYTTFAREHTDVRVVATERTNPWGEAALYLGTVEVTRQAVSFLRRRVFNGEVIGEDALDLPPRHLQTKAVWWTVSEAQLRAAGLTAERVPGAAHAAEHAAIGLLPLFATCDRWDVGGVSTSWHESTGCTTVWVYDGHPGGAGFAERGYEVAHVWLQATRDAIMSCACESGCPSCIQSPKCGDANSPLDKPGAVCLLDLLLAGAVAGATAGNS